MPLVTTEMNISSALKNVHIIPDVIEDENFAPVAMIDIEYPSSGQKVEMGNRLTPQETAEKPKVSFLLQDDNSDAAYTLIMMDPDAPSTTDRQFGPWRHWIVVNIQGSDLGNEHTPYIGPGPKPNSGEHRYIFLLFKQSKGANQSFQPMAHDTVPSRRNFDVKQFVRDHDLELVGINFFLCSGTQQQ